MGLFSSKKKTKVFTSVVRVIEDSQLPDSAKAGVLKAIVRDENISEHLVDAMTESIVFKAERMYEYAAKNYYYGVPKSTLITDIQGEGVVDQVLERILGKPITLDYCKFAPINSLHVGWMKLVEQYGYDEASNEITGLSAQHGTPVYLKDMVVVYSRATLNEAEPSALEKWGKSPSSGYTPERKFSFSFPLFGADFGRDVISESALTDSVLVKYVFVVPITEKINGLDVVREELREGQLSIPITGYDEEEDYYHVKYYYDTQTGRKAGYWLYEDGSGGYPEIDAIYRTDYDEIGDYFPIVYFRHDKQNRTLESLRDTHAFKSTQKVLKYLNMDFIDMAAAIHENPDIKDIEQAFMMFGVPADTENEVQLRYLFEYFNLLYYTSEGDYTLPGMLKGGGFDPWERKIGRAINIADAEFNMTLSYESIGKRRVAGTIGPVGSHAGGIEYEGITQEYQGLEGIEYIVIRTPYRYYRRQVNKTFYEEVSVFNPRLTYAIWRGKNYVAGAGNEALLIPLDRSLTGLFSMPDREVLYSRSLHFVFNTRITTKQKWYQSGWFKIVMIVVAIVLTILYPPGGAAMWAKIAAMGTAIYIAAIIVTVVVMQVVVSAVTKVVSKALGAEVAMVLAVIAIIWSGGRSLQAGLTAMQKLTADVLLSFATNLAKAAVNQYTTTAMDKYRSDLQEFDLMSDKLTKELEEIKQALDVSVDLDPFEFIAQEPMLIPAEKPDAFYQRTVHSGNIGITGLEAVRMYVDLSLKLPEFNDTVGDSSYDLG